MSADQVYKHFAGTQALAGVSVDCLGGEVHALIGENGAGKSTLIKIMGGVHRADRGTIRVAGDPRAFAGPADALAAGIVTIPQEMRIVPALSVAENVLLGHIPMRRRAGVLPDVDRIALRARAAEILHDLNFDIDVDRAAGTLTYAERQLVMIGRALSRRARVLILDEPTAALEAREVARLFDVIGRLKARGVALVFISHRLDEVVELADRCTVLRDGQVVDRCLRGEFDAERLIRSMTGRDLEELRRVHDARFGAAVLEVPSLGHAQSAPAESVLRVREREVVGLAGLLGSGTTQLLRRLFGADAPALRFTLRGAPAAPRSPAEAIALGFGLVPGERAHGLVMALSVRDNVALTLLDRNKRAWRLDGAMIDGLVAELMDALDIRPRDPAKPVGTLSGGNQQKVIFAKWLARQVGVLLLDEPTHGIDIGAKTLIHRLMHDFAAKGGAILFSSSETLEVVSISDSVLAMKKGEVVARMDRTGDYNEKRLREALGG
ncbi:MAG TPA: sugar ABC transporter ATP-binding protein [Alphaproteobacteria bacterium]|nr:sugar ABC transporter ATP-binding protein [Alphaproteobacteria bacterium]